MAIAIKRSNGQGISSGIFLLNNDPSAVCLLQAIQSEGDACVQKLTVPYVYFAPGNPAQKDNRLMCFFLTKAFAEDEYVGTAFRKARPFTFLAVLTRLPGSINGLTPKTELSTETVRLLSTKTEYLIAEAFDGDSYFIWSRDSQ